MKKFYFQHKIFLAKKRYNFFIMHYYQRLFICSLFLRIKALEHILSEYYENTKLTSEEKFRVACNLKDQKISKCSKFYNLKDKGLSFYYDSQNLYDKTFSYLWSSALLPFTETNLDKCSFEYRPYRNHYDFLIELKNVFSKEINKEKLLLKIKSFCSWNATTSFWLMKNFPFIKKTLINFIFRPDFLDTKNSLYITLINYMLNGLVRIR